MASQIEQQIQALIEAFDRLAQKSDIPKQTVTKVNNALNALLTGKDVAQNIDSISTSLTILKNRLSELGQTETIGIGNLVAVREFAKQIKIEVDNFSRAKNEFNQAVGYDPNTALRTMAGGQRDVEDVTRFTRLQQIMRSLNETATEFSKTVSGAEAETNRVLERQIALRQQAVDLAQQEALVRNSLLNSGALGSLQETLARQRAIAGSPNTGPYSEQALFNLKALGNIVALGGVPLSDTIPVRQRAVDPSAGATSFGIDEKSVDILNRVKAAAAEYATVEGRTNTVLEQQIAILEARNRILSQARLGGLQGRIAANQAGVVGVDNEVPLTAKEFMEGGPSKRGRVDPKPVQEFISALGSPRAIQNFQEALDKLGLSSGVVTRAVTDANSGITTISLSMDKVGGITRTATVRMNEQGEVLKDLSSRYTGFGQSVANNIVKVLNWAVALGVVYGALNRARELVQQTIDIQRELVEVQIATGQTSASLGIIFSQSATIAKQTGSSVLGVVEGFSAAFAATGDIENQSKRTATAQILLRDSMILSKLAGIEQSQALDTLTGGLRQAGLELDQGLTLIDKFVAVSKNANVSINTLASTFAIVGTAAEDVGIDFDELNALAATLAESSKLSADETGNAIRGFVSGFQSASAQEALASFGIAARDSGNDLRDFIDLLGQLAQLNKEGVISDRNLAEIGNIIGGGFRRGAQFATLLENYDRFLEISETSREASGDAAGALELQLNTLETAITGLGNAFSKIAETLGDDGGFITTLTLLTNAFSGILDLVSSLVDGLGDATPLLLAFGSALAVVSSTRFQTSGIGARALPSMLGGLPFARPTIGDTLYESGKYGQGTGVGPFLTRNAGAIGATAILAGVSAAEGDFNKAGATVGGAIVGALITGGNPIGLAVGGAIAASFYEALVNYDVDIIGRQIALSFGKTSPDETVDLAQSLATRFEESLSTSEKARAGISSFLQQTLLGAGRLAEIAITSLGGPASDPTNPLADRSYSITPEDVLMRQLTAEGGGFLDRESLSLLRALINQTDVEAQKQGYDTSPVYQEIGRIAEELRPLLEQLVQPYIDEQLGALSRGEISPNQFAGSKELATRLGEQAAIISVGLDTTSLDISAQEIVDILLKLKDEERVFIASIVGEIIDAQVEIDSINKTIAEGVSDPTVKAVLDARKAELESASADSRGKLEELFPAIQQAVTVRNVEQLPLIDFKGVTPEQVGQIVALGEQLQKEYLLQLGISEETADLIIAQNQESILRILTEGAQEFVGRTTVDQSFISQAAEQLGLNISGAGADSGFGGLLDYRDKFSTGELPGLQQRYEALKSQLVSAFPQFQPEESDFGVIASDGFGTIHADMTILNLLMEELIDVNKDQLNGIYNLPADASFFVPFTAALLDAQTRSLMAGLGGLTQDDTDVTDAINNTAKTVSESLVGVTRILPKDQRLAPEQEQRDVSSIEEARAEIESYLEEFNRRREAGEVDSRGRITSPVEDAAKEALQSVAESSIRLHLEIDSQTTLLVDGRILADIVKQFLYDDLLRSEGGATVTRTFVV